MCKKSFFKAVNSIKGTPNGNVVQATGLQVTTYGSRENMPSYLPQKKGNNKGEVRYQTSSPFITYSKVSSD